LKTNTMNLSDKKSRDWSHWLHASRIIFNRYQKFLFNGFGIYLTLALALVGGSIVINNNLESAVQNTILVDIRPLFSPALIMVILTSTYLAMAISISISKENDKGTLEVLMYGPVNYKSFLSGVFTAFIVTYLIGLLVFTFWANITIWLSHLEFSFDIYLLLLVSVITAGSMISYGIFIAALGGKTRMTIIYLILFIVLMVGIQIADYIVSTLLLTTSATGIDEFAILRDFLSSISKFLVYFSPFSLFQLMMDDIVNGSMGSFVIHVSITLGQIVLLLLFSYLLFKKEGVH
jgi:hypothetical protein